MVTRRPSAYAPLLRRMGGLDALLEQRELDLGQVSARDPGSRTSDRLEPTADLAEQTIDPVAPSGCSVDEEASGSVITYVDGDYPSQLRALFDPPPALFVMGERETHGLERLADLPLVAVVGTRAPSRYGREMAAALAEGLARAGVCVVSGLALGIDAVAHKAALAATSAPLPTVAVLGCGADVAYPRTNLRLYREILSRGLVVSEYPWGAETRPWRFPARNRIIAALSQAAVIVEGAADSGSLITAEHALDLGRPVFAVPGEAGRRLSAAPHGLLRCGAHLCESAADVLSLLGLESRGPAWSGLQLASRRSGLGDGSCSGEVGLRDALLDALDEGEVDVDGLAVQVGRTASAVVAALGLLEVEGLVTTVGARYRVVRGVGRKD